MKIYTKKGDQGTTSLIGGERVSKSDFRVETYGNIDELNSWLGLIASTDISDVHKKELKHIQQLLFSVGAWFASIGNESIQSRLQRISPSDIEHLEKGIDAMNEKLPKLNSFVLTGGSVSSGYTSVARTVCRRAERSALKIPVKNDSSIEISYLNRLSDWLFVLSRLLNIEAEIPESYWK